jgi:parallel beta-helix repeat protein
VKDIALIQNAGSDSVGVAIVTTTNLKIVQPSVSLEKMALSQLYHNKPILIGETVHVDSAGVNGIFWTVQDAADAAGNAKVGRVQIGVGTFGHFDADWAGMVFTGSGHYRTGVNFGTIIDGGVADHAVSVDAKNVTIRDLSVITTAGGGCTTCEGIRLQNTSENFRILNNHVINSDGKGISIEGGGQYFGIIQGNHIQISDGDCIEIGGGYNRIIGNTCYSTGGGIDATNTSDGSSIVGNVVGNAKTIGLVTGADNIAVSGNATDAAITNNGSGNSLAGNSVF